MPKESFVLRRAGLVMLWCLDAILLTVTIFSVDMFGGAGCRNQRYTWSPNDGVRKYEILALIVSIYLSHSSSICIHGWRQTFKSEIAKLANISHHLLEIAHVVHVYHYLHDLDPRFQERENWTVMGRTEFLKKLG